MFLLKLNIENANYLNYCRVECYYKFLWTKLTNKHT